LAEETRGVLFFLPTVREGGHFYFLEEMEVK
jgi:hypothetical protein